MNTNSSNNDENYCVPKHIATTSGRLSVHSINPFLNQTKNNKLTKQSTATATCSSYLNDVKNIVDIFNKKKNKDVSTAVSKILIDDLLKDSVIDVESLKQSNKKKLKEFLDLLFLDNKSKKARVENNNVVRINSALCSFSTSKINKTPETLDTTRLFLKSTLKNESRNKGYPISTAYYKTIGRNNNIDITKDNYKILTENAVQCHILNDDFAKDKCGKVGCDLFRRRYGIGTRDICRNCNQYPQHDENDFIETLIDKNLKLQRAVDRFIVMRQRDTNRELWNNFINQLKIKHGYNTTIANNNVHKHSSEYVIPKFTKNSYENLIEDVYQTCDSRNTEIFKRCLNNKIKRVRLITKSYDNMYAFHAPSTSEKSTMCNDKLIYTNQDKKIYRGDIDVNRVNLNLRKRLLYDEIAKKSGNQTSVTSLESISEETTKGNIKEQLERASSNCEKLRKKINNDCKTLITKSSLANIENKLDTLINSINTAIVEIKSNKDAGCKVDNTNLCDKAINVIVEDRNSNHNTTPSRHSAKSLISKQTKHNNDTLKNTNANNKFLNEIDGDDAVTKDVGNVMLQTEIQGVRKVLNYIESKQEVKMKVSETDSKRFCVEDKKNENKQCFMLCNRKQSKIMTSAVNTDPLGILALLKMSTESVKQLLALMPSIDYHSYLPALQFNPNSNIKARDYPCNICGASFLKPSDLNKHIYGHDLGKVRDCCICRHILDLQKSSKAKLFVCRHCGHCFTRSYCCELHQQECARRMGKKLDERQSLLLLK